MEEVVKKPSKYEMLLITIFMISLIWLSTYLPITTNKELELADECYIENTKDNYNNKLSSEEKLNQVQNLDGMYCKTKMTMKYVFPMAYYFTRWINLD